MENHSVIFWFTMNKICTHRNMLQAAIQKRIRKRDSSLSLISIMGCSHIWVAPLELIHVCHSIVRLRHSMLTTIDWIDSIRSNWLIFATQIFWICLCFNAQCIMNDLKRNISIKFFIFGDGRIFLQGFCGTFSRAI